MIVNRLDNEMTAYRVEVETTNAVGNTTQALDKKQYLDCCRGVVIVVTDDPAMIMRTFRVVKLEKIGPGYAMEKERDEAIITKDNLCQQNTKPLEDVAALILERDDALKEGMALVQEKDGLQIEIERLRGDMDGLATQIIVESNASYDVGRKHKQEEVQPTIDALTAKVRELEEELAQLKRGEYICAKCGLRKDGESQGADF